MLTIDIGNTRLKWGLWENSQIVLSGGCVHDFVFDQQMLDHCLPDMKDVKKVCVSNVAGEKTEIALRQWFSNKVSIDLFFLKTQKVCCGVTNAYPNPSMHGVDRWAALIAAKSLSKTAVCVIDIGTAVTIDLMNDKGLHEGGLIMPGLDLMQETLLSNTVDISFNQASSDMLRFDVKHVSEHFATNTQDAVQSGTLSLLRAGLDDVCGRVVSRYDGNVSIFLTGGLAEKMLPLLPVDYIIHEPHLVLKGLHVAGET